MPGPDPLVELDAVTAGYGGAPVLRDVSIAVRPGEVVGLVGPNGSGKTSVVRVASRALRPIGGLVRIGGRDPYAGPAREAARLVAVVPQDLYPAFSFTALEVVLMGRAPYLSRWGGGGARDWARTREAMVATEVQHLADRPVEELSGGERRRVVLAQALAQDAPALLLDEPLTHLDLRHVLDLLGLVRRLAQHEGKAVLAIFHDLTVAASACDRLVVLHRGRVVAEGEPSHVVTTELLETVWEVRAEVRDLDGRPTVLAGPPRDAPAPVGRRAHVIGGAGRGAPLMRRLAERGYEVTAGVLHATDTDALTAERLNLRRVTVPPFSEIDRDAADECRGLIRHADVVILCDAPFGPANLENLVVALEAARAGTRVILLEEVPMAGRDFTGGRAGERWRELSRLAVRAGSYDEVMVEVG